MREGGIRQERDAAHGATGNRLARKSSRTEHPWALRRASLGPGRVGSAGAQDAAPPELEVADRDPATGPEVRERRDGRPPPGRPSEFAIDNRPSRVDDRRWKLPRLAVVLALVGIFASDLAYVAASQGLALAGPWDDRGAGAAEVALLAAMVAFIAIGLAGVPRLLPGADRIVVREDGLDLTYARGRTVHLPWGGNSGAVLRDSSSDAVMTAANLAHHLSGPRFWSRRTLVTRSTQRAILAFAERHGVPVSRRSVRARWTGVELVVYRFGRRDERAASDDRRSSARAP